MNCSEAASSTSKKPLKSLSSGHLASGWASALRVLFHLPNYSIPLHAVIVIDLLLNNLTGSHMEGSHPAAHRGYVWVSSLRGSAAPEERTCSL